MGHAGERVPMEQVIDLEGTAPPGVETASPSVGGRQPETIQEEKEEEVGLPTGRTGLLDMEDGGEDGEVGGGDHDNHPH